MYYNRVTHLCKLYNDLYAFNLYYPSFFLFLVQKIEQMQSKQYNILITGSLVPRLIARSLGMFRVKLCTAKMINILDDREICYEMKTKTLGWGRFRQKPKARKHVDCFTAFGE